MIYNVYNEVVCDYNCESCDAAEDCADRIDKDIKNIEDLHKIVELNK